jgi:PIN domain nuclease of toxin-antitoxin system
VKLLLDTRTLLWWLFDLPQLRPPAREAIANPDNQVYVSAVSALEIATRQAIGTLEAPADLEQQVAANWFMPLAVTIGHGLAVRDLPIDHRDPFSRLLVAQARCENLTLVTSDATLAEYGVQVLPT